MKVTLYNIARRQHCTASSTLKHSVCVHSLQYLRCYSQLRCCKHAQISSIIQFTITTYESLYSTELLVFIITAPYCSVFVWLQIGILICCCYDNRVCLGTPLHSLAADPLPAYWCVGRRLGEGLANHTIHRSSIDWSDRSWILLSMIVDSRIHSLYHVLVLFIVLSTRNAVITIDCNNCLFHEYSQISLNNVFC